MKTYKKPYTVQEIRKNYPRLANKLLQDPVHLWRAETGVELVHQEPTKKELERIWVNWQEMGKDQQKLSDQKSLELFGLKNAAHYRKLVKKY